MLTPAALNALLNTITPSEISLHSGPPGAAGTDNELTGGGYARLAPTYPSSTAQERDLSTPLLFDVPAGTVSHYVVWEGATPKDITALDAAEVFAAAGQYQLNSAKISASST